MAIDQQVLDRVRHCVCAIGFRVVAPKRLPAEPNLIALNVVGTGFLVADDLVLTNRHVMEELARLAKRNRFRVEERLALEFVVSDGRQIGRLLARPVTFAVHTEHEFDLAIIQVDLSESPDQAQYLQIAQFGDPSSLVVGQDISVLGYSHGSTPLTRQGSADQYRFGPLLQQGAVSALAPYDRIAEPQQLLLDISVAGGASGSPVFSASSGEVFGIVHSGIPPVYTLALPLYRDFVNGRIDAFRRELKQEGAG